MVLKETPGLHIKCGETMLTMGLCRYAVCLYCFKTVLMMSFIIMVAYSMDLFLDFGKSSSNLRRLLRG